MLPVDPDKGSEVCHLHYALNGLSESSIRNCSLSLSSFNEEFCFSRILCSTFLNPALDAGFTLQEKEIRFLQDLFFGRERFRYFHLR